MTIPEIRSLTTQVELRDYFADATGVERAVYLGAALETYTVGSNAALFVLGPLVERTMRADVAPGLYVRVFLAWPYPVPVVINSRPVEQFRDRSIPGRFLWAAPHTPHVPAFAIGELEAALLDLTDRFTSVTLNQRSLGFGPLLGTPAESAEAVHGLVTRASRFFRPGGVG